MTSSFSKYTHLYTVRLRHLLSQRDVFHRNTTLLMQRGLNRQTSKSFVVFEINWSFDLIFVLIYLLIICLILTITPLFVIHSEEGQV